MNPSSIGTFKAQGKAGTNEFVRTMFHEQLDNLGYLHGHDVEYAYTCEKCCFPAEDDSKDARDASCRVCSGNYKGTTDIAYIKDITAYGQKNFTTNQALSSTIKYLRENPADLSGLSFLAVNISGVFNPIGAHLGSKLKEKNRLSVEQLKLIDDAEKYKESSHLKPFEKSSKLIADAYYESYHTQNPMAALELLKKQSRTIKDQLNQKNGDENSSYVKDSLKNGIKKLVYDIWLDGHKGKLKDPAIKEKLSTLSFEIVGIYDL